MAADVRRSVVTTVDRAGFGHIGGDLSVTDILVTLFGAVLDVDPTDPTRPDRDRLAIADNIAVAHRLGLSQSGASRALRITVLTTDTATARRLTQETP
jgi:transketolase